jgi:hypothetical protein
MGISSFILLIIQRLRVSVFMIGLVGIILSLVVAIVPTSSVQAYGSDGIVKITVKIQPPDNASSIFVVVKRAANSSVGDNEKRLTRVSADTFTGDMKVMNDSCSTGNTKELQFTATVFNSSGGGTTGSINETLGTSGLQQICNNPTSANFTVAIKPVTTDPTSSKGTICGNLTYFDTTENKAFPYKTVNSNVIAVMEGSGTKTVAVKTDDSGKYCIGNVTPGKYKLTAAYSTSAGVSKDNWTSPVFEVLAGKTATVNHIVTSATDTTSTTETPEETCNITGVGWIVCPVATMLGGLTDAVYSLVEKLLVFDLATNPFDTTNPVYKIWVNIRDVANIAFVIAFFAVIFSQATSMGISAYGIRKMLPRIIAAAIMINLSYYICVLGVDISNIIGGGIDNLLKSALAGGAGTSSDPATAAGTLSGIGVGVLITGLLAGGVAAAGGFTAALASLLVFLPMILLAILVALVVLIARQAILVMLIILSPLAFAAFILPGTEKMFDTWRKTFITMLIFYPLAALLFAGSSVAASVLRLTANSGSGTDQLMKVFSLGVQTFPLFGMPFLLKFSSGILGKLAGVVNNPNKGPFDKMTKGAEARRDRFQNNMRAQKLGDFNKKSGTNPSWFRRGAGATAARQARAGHLNQAAQSNLGLAQQQQVGNALSNPNSKFAQQAAGYTAASALTTAGGGFGNKVDGDAVARAVAQGISALDELEAKNLKAGQTVLANAKLDGADLKTVARGGIVNGADGSAVGGTEFMQKAAMATLVRQGRDVHEVGEIAATSGSQSLREFFVGQVQSNYDGVKAKSAGMVDETLLKRIADSRQPAMSAAEYGTARVEASGRVAASLSVEVLAGQDERSMESIKSFVEGQIASGVRSSQTQKIIETSKLVDATPGAKARTSEATRKLADEIGNM